MPNLIKTEKVKVPVRLPGSLAEEIRPLWMQAYGRRGKSRWIEEAIKNFLNLSSYNNADFTNPNDDDASHFNELVLLGSDLTLDQSPDNLILRPEVVAELKAASNKIVRFRLEDATSDLVSTIIRAAICYYQTEQTLLQA